MTDVSTTEDQITVELEIDASPERVFDALTDPDQILEWWGDDEHYRTEEAAVDLREGGRWRAAGHNIVSGTPFTVTGEYLVVERPRLLRYTWDPSWAEWEREEPTVVTIRLEPASGGTRLQLVHAGFAGFEKDRDDHAEGWPFVLELLRAHVDERGSSASRG